MGDDDWLVKMFTSRGLIKHCHASDKGGPGGNPPGRLSEKGSPRGSPPRIVTLVCLFDRTCFN